MLGIEKINYYSQFGLFSVNSNLIKKNKIDYYLKIISHMKDGDNILNGHFLEKSWYSIFKEK